VDGRGIVELSQAIDAHAKWQSETADKPEREAARRGCHVRILIERRVREVVSGMAINDLGAPIAEVYAKVVARLSAGRSGTRNERSEEGFIDGMSRG